jgi:hypothetical protein
VAFVSQGTTITWGGIALGEVVSIGVNGVEVETVDVTPRQSLTGYRSFSPTDVDLGTIAVTARGTALMTIANVGLTSALSIGGPSASWSFPKAIFQSLGWQASVGEMQLYNVTFKLGE